MKKMVLALLAIAGAICALPAQAAIFSTNYTSLTGSPMTAALTITTSDVLNSVGGYNILNVSGNVNGDAITGVVANPGQPASTWWSEGLFIYNNVFYDQPQFLNSDGMLFSTASGLKYNMWGVSDTSFSLYSGYQKPSGEWDYGAASDGFVGPVRPVQPTPVASYNFGGTLAADESGRPALAAINPTGTNSFVQDNVFGTERTVYDFDTAATGGGLIYSNADHALGDNYSVVMTVKFTDLNSDSQTTNLVDVGGPAGDGLKVTGYNQPDGLPGYLKLADWPPYSAHEDPAIIGDDQWHNVALTVAGQYYCMFADGRTVTCGGGVDFMSLANSNDMVKFLTAVFPGTSATGQIANLSLFSEALSKQDAMNLTAIMSSPAPEPASWALMLCGFGLTGYFMRRRRQVTFA